jgi:hypothetical protein
MGFYTSGATPPTPPANGVYFVQQNRSNVAPGQFSEAYGQISVNSVSWNTSTSYKNISHNNATAYPFYTYIINIISYNNVNFSIYDNENTLVWSENITGRDIPLTTGREVDCGYVITNQGGAPAGAPAFNMATTDFILCEVETARRIY